MELLKGGVSSTALLSLLMIVVLETTRRVHALLHTIWVTHSSWGPVCSSSVEMFATIVVHVWLSSISTMLLRIVLVLILVVIVMVIASAVAATSALVVST